jgi:hypothetical protein
MSHTASAAVTTPPPATTNSAASTSTAPGGIVCYFADASPCKVPAGFVWYVPLWPYSDFTQASNAATIGCPDLPNGCVRSAPQTALDFVHQYLGFEDISRVTSTKITADQAHIGVGYLNPAGQPVTAAVLHLVKYERYAASTSAPWEVVGSDDTTFSLETPKYGSTVGTSFAMGGHITGVDENIHSSGRSLLNTTVPVFDDCCLPAGGQNQAWSHEVGIPNLLVLNAATVPVTLVASTGGHVQQHERFAIQGIYVSLGS